MSDLGFATEEKVLPKGHGLIYSLLKIAVYQGQIDTLKNLLPKGLDINYEYPDGSTLLHYACRHQQKEIIQIILENGADVNKCDKDGYIPLNIVSSSLCDIDIFRLLLKYGAHYDAIDFKKIAPEIKVISLFNKIGKVFADVQYCNSEVIDKLRELNEDDSDVIVNARSQKGDLILEVALANQKDDIAYELMKKITYQTFLGKTLDYLENIKNGLSEMVGGLQCLGFDIENHNYFSIFSQDDNLNALIKCLNIIEGRLLHCYSKELLKVCTENDFVSVEKLIKRARLNLNNQVSYNGLPSYIKKALMEVNSQGGDYLKIKSILFYHASNAELAKFVINTKASERGLTPLHIAAKNGNLQIIKLLLKHGANYQSSFLIRDERPNGPQKLVRFTKYYQPESYTFSKTPKDLSANQDTCDFLKLVESYFAIDLQTAIGAIQSLNDVDLSAVLNAQDNNGRPIWFYSLSQPDVYKNDFFKLFKIDVEIVEQELIL